MKLLDFFMFVCKFAPVLTLKIDKDGNEKMNLAILQSDNSISYIFNAYYDKINCIWLNFQKQTEFTITECSYIP